jgi:cyclophilin family peptidyl-prolyl cis-trans isomerase
MKKFLILLFMATSLFAQYTKNDFRLVKTTATREFDRKLIQSYLVSSRPQKVIAGLLSVSHTLDTSYVPDIINLDFKDFGEYICFALGQLGASDVSSDYLFKKLSSKEFPKYNHDILDALGKIASEEDADRVFNLISEDKEVSQDGISIFIFNIFSRKVYFDKANIKQILLTEIRNSDQDRKLEALFTVARLGGMKEAENTLISILNSKEKINSAQVKSFALGCFTRQKYFPNNKNLINLVLKNPDWRVRTEAAKALVYCNYTTAAQVNNYYRLINDDNVNVARQAAISVRNIKLNSTLLAHLNNLIEQTFTNIKTITKTVPNPKAKKAVKSKTKSKSKSKSRAAKTKSKIVVSKLVKGSAKSDLNPAAKGELFISYCTLNPAHIMEAIKKYDKEVEDKYAFEVLSNQAVPAKEAYAYISKKTYKSESNLLDLAPALLSLQGKLHDNQDYDSRLLEMLDSKYSSVSSTIADGIDSSFAVQHFESIKEIITSQIKAHLNDARYYETLVSMYNLGERANKELKPELINELKGSKLFTIQKFVNEKSGLVLTSKKEFANLESLWKNAFTYNKAVVKTQKGEFTIKFHPEYTPVSVGNFVSLVKKEFYNGVAFHRVVPNFVAQTGDSTGTGFGGPGYDINSEFSPQPFNTNYVGMASAGKDTEGSQWYVMHNVAYHLYGKYSNFGKVIDGMEVIPMINQGDKIINIRLVK